MEKRRLFTWFLILMLSATNLAFAQTKAKPLTNGDVVAMVKEGLPEDVIISSMSAQDTSFDVSAAALLALKKQGVSSKIMDAMLLASKEHAAAASPTAAAVEPESVRTAPVLAGNSPQQRTSAPVESIPAGTVITVRTIDPIDSQKVQVGQTFRASLDESIVANNQTVAVKGSDVLLKLVAVKQSGKITGSTELTVEVDSVLIDGNRIAVSTEGVTSASGGRGQKSAKVIGGSAAVGAVLGGIFGGAKGAAAGAAAGAGAGTAVQLVTKGQHVLIPSESRLSFAVSWTGSKSSTAP